MESKYREMYSVEGLDNHVHRLVVLVWIFT